MRIKKPLYYTFYVCLVFVGIFFAASRNNHAKAAGACIFNSGPPIDTADQFFKDHTGVWPPSLAPTASYFGYCVPQHLEYPPAADPAAFPGGASNPGYSNTADYEQLCQGYQQYLVPSYMTVGGSGVSLVNRNLPVYGQGFQGYPQYKSTSSAVSIKAYYAAYLCSPPTTSHPAPIPSPAIANSCTSVTMAVWLGHLDGGLWKDKLQQTATGQPVCDSDLGGSGGGWSPAAGFNFSLSPGVNKVCVYYSGLYQNGGAWGVATTTDLGVGWCSYITYVPQVLVTGRTIALDITADGNSIESDAGLKGVQVSDCNNQVTTSTNDTGGGGHKANYSIYEDMKHGFCLSASPVAGYNGPFVRPYGEGYPGVTPNCPKFSVVTDSPSPNYCSQSKYDWQAAGVDAKVKASGFAAQYNSKDRSSDAGYDFVYIKKPPPTCGGITTDPSQPEVGSDFTVTAPINYSSGNLAYNWTASLQGKTLTGKGNA
ncbi:MAG: hypothetical protein ABI221_01105, partial [Candidatus Saccharimonadales bacterium]